MRKMYATALGVVVLTGAALAQGGVTPPMQVPAIREPHHFVKLDNKYTRVLDVTVEPFSGTLYHIHENPYFWISIGPATLRGPEYAAPCEKRPVRFWEINSSASYPMPSETKAKPWKDVGSVTAVPAAACLAMPNLICAPYDN